MQHHTPESKPESHRPEPFDGISNSTWKFVLSNCFSLKPATRYSQNLVEKELVNGGTFPVSHKWTDFIATFGKFTSPQYETSQSEKRAYCLQTSLYGLMYNWTVHP